MRGRLLLWLLVLVPSLGLSACGTGSFPSTFRVSVDDPDRVLSSDTVDVSVFDVARGDTRDWAERSLGTSSPGEPYVETVSSVESRMMFDNGPSPRVRAGLYLPGYREHGWYALEFAPKDGVEQTVDAPFVAWDGYASLAAGVPPLPVRVLPRADGNAWDLAVTATLRGPAPDETSAVATTDPTTLELIAAAGAGDLDRVKDLLMRGADINGADANGRTALIAAARADESETAQYLAQFGADVNLVDADGDSAYLISTSEVGPRSTLIVWMIEGGADLSAVDRRGRTGVIRAAERGYAGNVTRLLVKGASPDAVDDRGRTALLAAIGAGGCSSATYDTVQALVGAGADVDLSAPDGTTPLALARDRGCDDIAALLRRAGARG